MAKRKTETYVDKSSWKRGEWDSEPDRVEWRYNGLTCLIVRGGLGALCGYVGVPPGHPHHGKGYGEVDARCHGGLTYSATCSGKICHVPHPGESPDVWWLGFDCAHFGDCLPETAHFSIISSDDTYRNVAYVTAEVERLADQLQEAN